MLLGALLPALLDGLFSSDGFMPHGHCYLWNPGLVALHVTADALTALAYASIPITLASLVLRRADLPFNWMLVCFGIFIVACGATHVMEIWTLWTPTYWLAGGIKAVTAIASVATAVLFARLLPSLLAVPTGSQLAAAHEALGRAHEVLRESEERYRLLFEKAGEAIYLLHEEADGAVSIVQANEKAAQMHGYAAAEMCGTDVRALLAPRPAAAAAETLRGLVAEGWSAGAIEHLRRDGSSFPVEYTAGPVELGGQRCLLVFLRDITEPRRAVEALRAAKESAEAANRELTAFSYSVAHDLRAPLRGVSGFAQVLVEDYADKLDAEGRDCLLEIQGGARHMGALIDALLSLSRVTRSALSRERVDLTALARGIAAGLAAAEPARGVAWAIADDLHADADPALTRTLLENLLGNAWKFTGKSGAARIEVGAAREDGADVFFVRDNGAGFDMAHADKLFGAFQRLHTVGEFPGTGIGLATVQRIVRRHGGSIRAEGAVGAGATFHFTLESPAAETP